MLLFFFIFFILSFSYFFFIFLKAPADESFFNYPPGEVPLILNTHKVDVDRIDITLKKSKFEEFTNTPVISIGGTWDHFKKVSYKRYNNDFGDDDTKTIPITRHVNNTIYIIGNSTDIAACKVIIYKFIHIYL